MPAAARGRLRAARALMAALGLLFAGGTVLLIVMALNFRPVCLDNCYPDPPARTVSPAGLAVSAVSALHAAGWFWACRVAGRHARSGNGRDGLGPLVGMLSLIPSIGVLLGLWGIAGTALTTPEATGTAVIITAGFAVPVALGAVALRMLRVSDRR